MASTNRTEWPMIRFKLNQMNVGILANLLATYGNIIFHSICVFYFLSLLFYSYVFFSSSNFELGMKFQLLDMSSERKCFKKIGTRTRILYTYIKQRGQNGKVCNIKSRPMEKKLTTLN